MFSAASLFNNSAIEALLWQPATTTGTEDNHPDHYTNDSGQLNACCYWAFAVIDKAALLNRWCLWLTTSLSYQPQQIRSPPGKGSAQYGQNIF